MRRKSTLRIVRIVMTVALVAAVLYRTGLFSAEGWQDLFGTFAQISWPYLLASIGIGFLLILSSAFKWYLLLRSRGLAVPLWRLYAYYTIGVFFNLILPTSMGGDVVRVNELGRYTGRYPEAVASVFVERFTGMATLAVLALIAVVVNLQLFNLPWLTVGLGLMGAGIAGIIWLVIDERPFQLANRLLATRLPFLQKLFAKIEKFQQAVLAYKNDPAALLGALINSLIFYLLAVVNVWLSALAFGSDLSFFDMLVAVPVILLIMNLPISIGGIGLMEFAYSFTLTLFGATPALAVSTALLIRGKSFLYAGMGGLFYLLLGGSNQSLTSQVAGQSSD